VIGLTYRRADNATRMDGTINNKFEVVVCLAAREVVAEAIFIVTATIRRT
jgi:hypothetical protein